MHRALFFVAFTAFAAINDPVKLRLTRRCSPSTRPFTTSSTAADSVLGARL